MERLALVVIRINAAADATIKAAKLLKWRYVVKAKLLDLPQLVLVYF